MEKDFIWILNVGLEGAGAKQGFRGYIVCWHNPSLFIPVDWLGTLTLNLENFQKNYGEENFKLHSFMDRKRPRVAPGPLF
jgi:hypothetical protein